MRTLERNKRPVAVARRYETNGVETYGIPTKLKINFRNTRGAAAMDGLGEAVDGTLVAIVTARDSVRFREFDKVYVFTEPPLVHDSNAAGADYVVEAVMPGLNGTEIRLKRVNL